MTTSYSTRESIWGGNTCGKPLVECSSYVRKLREGVGRLNGVSGLTEVRRVYIH